MSEKSAPSSRMSCDYGKHVGMGDGTKICLLNVKHTRRKLVGIQKKEE
jgi:hypothetical protein